MAREKSPPVIVAACTPIHFLCIDPSERRTGVTLGVASGFMDPTGTRVQIDVSSRRILRVGSFPSRTRGGFEEAMSEVARWIPPGPWVPICERPPPPRFGDKASSLHAFKSWEQWVIDVAHDRAEAARVAYRDAADAFLDPMPGQWRQSTGLPTQAPKTIKAPSLRALWLKVHAMDFAVREIARWHVDEKVREHAQRLLAEVDVRALERHPGSRMWQHEDREDLLESGASLIDHDGAESVCVFTWATRSVGSIGTWLAEGQKPRRLLAIL